MIGKLLTRLCVCDVNKDMEIVSSVYIVPEEFKSIVQESVDQRIYQIYLSDHQPDLANRLGKD